MDRLPASSPSPAWWAPCAALALAAALVAVGGDAARAALRWERAALAAEPWRLVTGQLAHLGVRHLLLNLAALALIAALARVERARALTGARGALTIAVALAGTGFGLLAFEPTLDWYVGLSGALHGMLAAVAIERAAERAGRWWGLALLAALAAKLAWELGAGPRPTTVALVGGPVVVAAHLHGAVAGAAVALALALRDRRRPQPTAQV